MSQRISGKSFHINIGNLLVFVESASLSITDNRQVAMTSGIPNGYVDGDVSASGELELDVANFSLIKNVAQSAGSYKDLAPFDIVFYAETQEEEMRVEAFGCLLKISDIFNIDPKGGEKIKLKLPFDITSSEFIRINGVPYLSPDEIRDLI